MQTNVKHRILPLDARRSKKTITKALAKKTALEDITKIKDILTSVAYGDSEPDTIMRKLANDLLSSKTPDRGTIGKSVTNIRKAMEVYGLDTHFLLSETVEKQYRGQVIEFSRQLIEDYDCKTAGEKALAQVVVSAYARVLLCSRGLNTSLSAESTPITQHHRGYYSVLSKELDRANRQFTTALSMLVQLKKPSLEINIKAKTAYVAQQQLNISQPDTKNHEIIEAK